MPIRDLSAGRNWDPLKDDSGLKTLGNRPMWGLASLFWCRRGGRIQGGFRGEGCFQRRREPLLEGALEAEDVDGGAPDGVGTLESVGGPLVGFVEALGAEVIDKSEEVGLAEAERDHVGASGRDQSDADTESPGVGIDIEGGELAVVGKVGLLRGACGGEAVDDVAGDSDDGVGVERIGVGEIVFVGAVFRAELIEVAGGEDSGVAVLPGADVDARDGESVSRLGGTEKHGASIARETAFSPQLLA